VHATRTVDIRLDDHNQQLVRSSWRSALGGFIGSHRDRFGVGPPCAVLGFPVSTYDAAKKQQRNPSARQVRDHKLKKDIMRVREDRRKAVRSQGPRIEPACPRPDGRRQEPHLLQARRRRHWVPRAACSRG
jgi:hypothetical protein